MNLEHRTSESMKLVKEPARLIDKGTAIAALNH
jgi:hypothetical protein